MTAIAQRCCPVLQPTQHQAMTGTAQLVLTPALHSGCPRRGGRRHRSVGGRAGHRAAPGARQPLSRSPGLALHAGGCRMCPLGRKKGSPRPGRKGDLPPARAPASHVANKTIPPVHLRNSFGLFWPHEHTAGRRYFLLPGAPWTKAQATAGTAGPSPSAATRGRSPAYVCIRAATIFQLH